MTDPDELRAKVRSLVRKDAPVFRGYVSRGGRLVHWTQADTAYDGSIKQHEMTPAEKRLIRSLHADLPTVRKRTPQERLKQMTDTLVATGVRHGDGTWSFPRSVTRAIAVLVGGNGEFVTEETIEKYAAALLQEAEKKNKPTREVKV